MIKRIIILINIFLLISISGCFSKIKGREGPIPLPTMISTPEYVYQMYPLENLDAYNGSKESIYVFTRGIAITIILSDTKIIEENWEDEIIHDRINLILNGEEVTKNGYYGGLDGEAHSGMFRLSWIPNLTKGIYEAELQIEEDNGNILSYQWWFELR